MTLSSVPGLDFQPLHQGINCLHIVTRIQGKAKRGQQSKISSKLKCSTLAMGCGSSSKRDQFGPESEYYNLIVEMNRISSLPLFKYLLEKVRLPRHLGLCKTRAERDKANAEIHVGWGDWGQPGWDTPEPGWGVAP